jgi:hypothetical protein
MRRVVIHLHGSSSDTTSLASAIDFCRKLNARLSVVFIRRTREFIPAPADGIPGAFYETETEAAPEAERAYREMCDGLSFISYTEADIDSVEMITQNGLLHDLTVVELVPVGDTRSPPSVVRADMLPVEPCVSPRSNIDLASTQICSRRRASSVMRPNRRCRVTAYGVRARCFPKLLSRAGIEGH